MTIEAFLFAAWLAASITLLLAFKVFSPKSLAQAPLRRGAMTLATVAAVTLVYIALIFAAVDLLHQYALPNAASHPSPLGPVATTATAPAPLPAASRLATSTAASRTRPLASPAPPTTLSTTDLLDTVTSQSLDALAKLLAALFSLIFVQQTMRGGVLGLGLRPSQFPKGLALGALAFLVIYPLLVVCNNLFEYLWVAVFQHTPTVQPTIQALASHPPIRLKIAFFLLAAVAAPILEEYYFRGLLQTALTGPNFGLRVAAPADLDFVPSPAHRWAAIALTSALFAAAHGSIDIYPTLFLLSLALGYTYERTGNLYANITLHAAFNTLNMLPLLLS